MCAPPHRDWFEIVQEVRTELGNELFLLARTVWLVANTPLGRRMKLFRLKKMRFVGERRIAALQLAPPDLRADLKTIMRLAGHKPPLSSEVAAACDALVAWAQSCGYTRTALHYAEAAAAIAPEDPYFAFAAGRANRILGKPDVDYWRAEAFYDRAIRYAYRTQNWPVYIRAHLGYGRLLADRGRLEQAADHLSSAAAAAVDQGQRWLTAQTLHDLMALYFQNGDLLTARKYAVEVVRAYPRHNERFPIAIHDALFLYLVDGYYCEILPSLQMLYRAPLPPHEQVLIAGTLARTAGHLNERDIFAECESRVLHLSLNHDLFSAAAHINLAFGAWALDDFDTATEYAKRGAAIAKKRKDAHVLAVARILLQDLRARKQPLTQRIVPETDAADQLAQLEELVGAHVPAWHGETWWRKEDQAGPLDVGPV
jgi:tetratricopeptide (TPR) repeat protein